MIKIELSGAHAQALLNRSDLLAELASLGEVEMLPEPVPMVDSPGPIVAALYKRQLEQAAAAADRAAIDAALNARSLDQRALNALDPFTAAEIAPGVWSVDLDWAEGAKHAMFMPRSVEVSPGIYTHAPGGVLRWWSPGGRHLLAGGAFQAAAGEFSTDAHPWVDLAVSDRLGGESTEEWLNRRALFFKAEQGDTRLGLEQVRETLHALTAEEPPEDARAALLALGSSDAVRVCWLAGGLWPLAHALGYERDQINSILGMLSAVQAFTAEVLDVYRGKHQLPFQPFQPWMLKDPNGPIHSTSDPFTQDDDQ